MAEICYERRIGSGTAHLNYEGELTIDNITGGELLPGTRGSISLREWTCGRDRVNISGVLTIKGVILRENVRPHCFTLEVPVNDYINVEGAEEGMEACCSLSLTSLTCRLQPGGHLEYKGEGDCDATVYAREECEYIAIPEDIPEECCRLNTLKIEGCPVRLRDTITLNEEMKLPMGKPNVQEVLCCGIRLSSVEARPVENILRLTGDINITLLYKGEGESNPMELFEETLPFKGELEAPGPAGDMLCVVSDEIISSCIRIQPDEDGEERVIQAEAVVGLEVMGRRPEEIQVLEDAYLINNTLSFDFKELAFTTAPGYNRGQCSVKDIVALPEDAPDMLQVYMAEGNPLVDYVGINEDSVDVEGVVEVTFLYVTEEDKLPVYSFTALMPFKHNARIPGISSDMGAECRVKARVEHLAFNMLSGRELEVRCLVDIGVYVEKEEKASLITGIHREELTREALAAIGSIVIYVVCKGDTLWKLAKRFNTSVDAIARLNDIENPDLIYPGQRLIIVKSVA